MEIKITINGLNQLTESLSLIGSALAYKRGMVNTAKAAVDLMNEVTEEKNQEVIDEKEEVQNESINENKETENDSKKEVKSNFTREDVRAAFVAKNSPSTRKQLKAILDNFGTPNISELEEEHFEDAMKELEAI